MEKSRRYNGFTNYETWAVSLWIGNDYASYQRFRQLARDTLAEASETTRHARREAAADVLAAIVRDLLHDGSPVRHDASVYADLMQAALDEVDWREVAEELLEDIDDGGTP